MRQLLPHANPGGQVPPGITFAPEELPLTVREAAVYLGVSIQTVYRNSSGTPVDFSGQISPNRLPYGG